MALPAKSCGPYRRAALNVYSRKCGPSTVLKKGVDRVDLELLNYIAQCREVVIINVPTCFVFQNLIKERLVDLYDLTVQSMLLLGY